MHGLAIVSSDQGAQAGQQLYATTAAASAAEIDRDFAARFGYIKFPVGAPADISAVTIPRVAEPTSNVSSSPEFVAVTALARLKLVVVLSLYSTSTSPVLLSNRNSFTAFVINYSFIYDD
jgi:hypothetical protein